MHPGGSSGSAVEIARGIVDASLYMLRPGRVETVGTPDQMRRNVDAIESSYLAVGPAAASAVTRP